MFPHTVTIYNVIEESDEEFHSFGMVNHITVLHGVNLDASKSKNVLESGLVDADSVILYIPFDVKALDGITGEEKSYIGPMEWTRAEDRTALWTMTLDGEGEGDTFFVKGEVVEPNLDLQGIALKYDGVYNITKVDTKDMGGLQHWEVGGA